MSPSLREIRMFVAVYEEQSFTGAAVREHATQSGVSQHIRNLEEQLGVQLLDRSKGVIPTPAGVAYYRRCIEVLKAHAFARRTLEEFSTGLAGSVVIGLMPTMTWSVLAPSTLRFTGQHPNVAIRIIEAYSGVLTNALKAGEIDFAILPRTPQATTGVKTTLFARTPEFLVSAAGSGPGNGEPVRLSDVEHLKLVVPGPTNVRRQVLEQYFVASKVQLESRLEFDSMPGTLDLVARSDWRVVLPGILVGGELPAGRFVINPLVNPTLLLDLMLVEPERQPLSATAQAFLDCLREVTDETNRVPFRMLEDAGLAQAT